MLLCVFFRVARAFGGCGMGLARTMWESFLFQVRKVHFRLRLTCFFGSTEGVGFKRSVIGSILL